jgi:hypothetical protein
VTLRVSEGTFEGRSPTLGTLKCSLSLASKRQKPRGQPYKLTDENGLHLLINPNGSKLWRFRYRFGGKQLIVAPGVVAASGYETPATSYIVANTTRIYSDLAVYGTNVTGELKRGEKVEALAKVKGWEWLLVGRQGTGIGYVPISMLAPEDKYIPFAQPGGDRSIASTGVPLSDCRPRWLVLPRLEKNVPAMISRDAYCSLMSLSAFRTAATKEAIVYGLAIQASGLAGSARLRVSAV